MPDTTVADLVSELKDAKSQIDIALKLLAVGDPVNADDFMSQAEYSLGCAREFLAASQSRSMGIVTELRDMARSDAERQPAWSAIAGQAADVLSRINDLVTHAKNDIDHGEATLESIRKALTEIADIATNDARG